MAILKRSTNDKEKQPPVSAESWSLGEPDSFTPTRQDDEPSETQEDTWTTQEDTWTTQQDAPTEEAPQSQDSQPSYNEFDFEEDASQTQQQQNAQNASQTSQNARQASDWTYQGQEYQSASKNATTGEYERSETFLPPPFDFSRDIEAMRRTLDKAEDLKFAEMCKGLLAQKWDDAKRIAEQRGRGLVTDIYFSVYRHGKYVLNKQPLTFKGLTVVAARTSGGKTLNLCSLMGYIMTRVQKLRTDQRARLAKEREYRDIKPWEEQDARPLYAVMISLEEASSEILARCYAAYIEYRQDMEEALHGKLGPRSLPRPSVEQLSQVLRGEPVTIDAWQPHRVEPVIDKYLDEFNACATVISQENVDMLSRDLPEGKRLKERLKLSNIDQGADFILTIRRYIESQGYLPVFFVDYIQKLHPDADDKSSAAYKDVQRVLDVLTEAASRGTIIFTAAQMNRDVAKEARNDKYKEFFSVISENMREGADIEQAAEMILYSMIIDKGVQNRAKMALRTLKYRSGTRDQFALAEIFWDTRTAKYENKEFDSSEIPGGDKLKENALKGGAATRRKKREAEEQESEEEDDDESLETEGEETQEPEQVSLDFDDETSTEADGLDAMNAARQANKKPNDKRKSGGAKK